MNKVNIDDISYSIIKQGNSVINDISIQEENNILIIDIDFKTKYSYIYINRYKNILKIKCDININNYPNRILNNTIINIFGDNLNNYNILSILNSKYNSKIILMLNIIPHRIIIKKND